MDLWLGMCVSNRCGELSEKLIQKLVKARSDHKQQVQSGPDQPQLPTLVRVCANVRDCVGLGVFACVTGEVVCLVNRGESRIQKLAKASDHKQ